MAVDYTAKQGDFQTAIRITLSESANSFDFTHTAGVDLSMAALGSSTLTLDTVAMDVVGSSTSTSGTFQHLWDTVDLDVSGYYYGEMLATQDDGTIKRFPSSGYFLIEVVGKLA
jgi:hypothetical protein